MTEGVDYTAVTDALGNVLPWRYCIDPPTDVHPKFSGTMSFDPESVPHAFGGDASTGLRELRGFRDVRPKHARPPELGRPVLGEAQLRFAALRRVVRDEHDDVNREHDGECFESAHACSLHASRADFAPAR